MKESVKFSKLKTWAGNHASKMNVLPFKSLSAAIGLAELERFIAEARQEHPSQFNAVKIYFVRYKFKPDGKETRLEKAKKEDNFSQVSLVFVPAQIINVADWTVKVLKDKADPDSILALRFCDPDCDKPEDETGMCPPKCPNNDDDGE